MQVRGTWITRAQSVLEQVTTTEGRLLASAALLATALVVSVFAAPRLAACLDGWLSDRFASGTLADTASVASHYVPATVGGVVLRTVQFVIVAATATAVLVLWGLSHFVVDLISAMGDQVPLLGKIAASLVVGFLAYVGAAFLSDAIANFSKQTEWMTEHQQEIVLRTSQLGLFVLLIFVTLGVWGVELDGLLAGAGFLGIVVGLAARQTLGSLIAGFVLMFSRPFTIGDWVRIGDEEGVVTDITIMNTRLENFDGEFVVIPNDSVSNRPITNRSQKGLLRLRVDVGVDYETDPEFAREVALSAMGDLVEVVDSPPPQVIPKAFGDSAIVLEMRFWIDHPTPPRKWKAVSAVVTSVKAAFESEGVAIPYPQRELSARGDAGGFRVHGTDDAADSSDGATSRSGNVD